VLACVLLVAAATAVAYEVHWSGILGTAPAGWVVGGAAALYGSTTAFVSACVLLPISDGFVAGHTLATVTWMVAALVLLARGCPAPVLPSWPGSPDWYWRPLRWPSCCCSTWPHSTGSSASVVSSWWVCCS